jgi:hypothetical protein
VVEKKDTKESEKPEVKVKAKARVKDPEPKSDMWAVYHLINDRLEAEDITVNGRLPNVELGKDFVNDDMAMIPMFVGEPPLFQPFTFTVRMTCVVAKGYETKTRLEILKNSVRAALKEPFVLGNIELTAAIIKEADSREVGVRKSALTISVKAEKISKRRL